MKEIKEWQKWKRDDLYYAVLTNKKFEKKNLTSKNKNEFFKSGEDEIENAFKIINKHFGHIDFFNSSLDFGCGVGRLSIPLSKFSKKLDCVDVSDIMLDELESNFNRQTKNNFCKKSFIKNSGKLNFLNNFYDLIYSHIVFQHISEESGMMTFEYLLNHLKKDGFMIVHFLYKNNDRFSYLKESLLFKVCKNFFYFFLNIFLNLEPIIEMNSYNLNKIFYIIQKNKFNIFHVEFTNHENKLGTIIYIKK